MKTKNIFTLLFVFAFLLAPAFSNAQQEQQGIHEAGTGLENPELKETNQGTGQAVETTGALLGEGNQGGVDEEVPSQGITRRNRVANAVQEMEGIAIRNAGLGTQIRTLAQNQNENQNQMEDALQAAQQRSGFAKFLIGPNYGQLKDVEERLENHNQNLEELKELRNQIQISSDQVLLDQQIQTMEEIKVELEEAVGEEQRGFSLFGWLNRLIVR
ncbi:MAG: hypothetical protein KAS02_00895 [Candidatus Pacebacteria bacterium]|nr:hypothetical protein [Candidatus Paceibacterota bacterium]